MTDFLHWLYIATNLPLLLYALGVCYLLLLYLLAGWRGTRLSELPDLPDISGEALPAITVQIPLYNERAVAVRALEAAAALDYPHDRLYIQVLDDSTDDTTHRAERAARSLRKAGLHVSVIHRAQRTGFKGGALAHGLKHTNTPFVAILDADFVPPRHFLQQAIRPLICNPRVGMVQARWDHLNPAQNWLTYCQVLMLDAHFMVDQAARAAWGLPVRFNGSGGLWRRACIEDAGGWQEDTLTEDADLSLRAQMKGWQCAFLPGVAVPGELPATLHGYAGQQARWAAGIAQVLIKLGGRLLRAPLSPHQKAVTFLGLLAYPLQPLALMMFMLSPWAAAGGAGFASSLPVLNLVWLAAPLLHILGQRALYPDWLRRSLRLPLLLALGAGLSAAISGAVLQGAWRFLRHQSGEFVRTPKNGAPSAAPAYRGAQTLSRWFWAEAILLMYALWGISVALRTAPGLAVYFAWYGLGFGLVMAQRGREWCAARPAKPEGRTRFSRS